MKTRSNNHNLNGKKVAIVVADGFEQEQMTSPRWALENAGAHTAIVSSAGEKVKGWRRSDWGESFAVDVVLSEADPSDYDALLLPGGVLNPDQLRRDPAALQFVRAFFAAGKPVGAICHGPWTLVDAGVVRGRRVTSYKPIAIDLKIAGANWVDEAVVVDHGLVTGRKPDDLPEFNSRLVEEIGEGIQLSRRWQPG